MLLLVLALPKGKLLRWHGPVMLALYGIYLTWLLMV